jgi:SNF2 family DNA or RNA helicase
VLRPYQRDGIGWLLARRDAGLGAMLADDMGLGKTLQALATIEGHTLVVAPASVLHAWVEETHKFRPHLKVSTYHGKRRILDPDADITVTTWALLRADVETLSKPRWATIILDEAQAIKNPDSQVAGAAFQLQADWRVTLSGTPIENRLEELWSQAHFVNPGLLGGRSDFLERTVKPIAQGDETAAARLRARIRPFLLRRRKEEVAPDLPPRIPVTRHCTLNPEERGVYDALAAAARSDVLERIDAGATTMQALEALLRLRQAACHSGLVPGQDADSSSKVEELLRGLESATAGDHKALVFSQWTGFLDRIEPHLDDAGIPWIRLDGSSRDRGAIVQAFQAPEGPPVLLISLKAGGTGLTLTAADHVFLMDPWWNPAVEDQAADRAHRIGQERTVIIHRMVARDTVEERILALQESKRALADKVLSGTAGSGGLTREELIELLA